MIEDISLSDFRQMLDFIAILNLGADVVGVELPCKSKDDNRVIALQKHF